MYGKFKNLVDERILGSSLFYLRWWFKIVLKVFVELWYKLFVGEKFESFNVTLFYS